MNRLNPDSLSFGAKAATDLLLVRNPVGTSMGLLTGFVLEGIVLAGSAFLPFLASIRTSGVGLLHWIALGVLLFNIRTLIRRDKVDPKIQEALDFIEQQVRDGRINRTQAKLRYNEIITKVVEHVRLDPQTADQLKRLTEQAPDARNG